MFYQSVSCCVTILLYHGYYMCVYIVIAIFFVVTEAEKLFVVMYPGNYYFICFPLMCNYTKWGLHKDKHKIHVMQWLTCGLMFCELYYITPIHCFKYCLFSCQMAVALHYKLYEIKKECLVNRVIDLLNMSRNISYYRCNECMLKAK